MSIQDEQELDLQLGEVKTQISELRKELYAFKQENATLKMALIKIQTLTEELNIHNFSMEGKNEGERSAL